MTNLYSSFLPVFLGMAVLALMSRKGARRLGWLPGVATALGLFMLGVGVSNISTAGAINAILIFESARNPIFTEGFNRLHETLDPRLVSGFIYLSAGAITSAAGLTSMNRQNR